MSIGVINLKIGETQMASTPHLVRKPAKGVC